jgi:hypothetical protein
MLPEGAYKIIRSVTIHYVDYINGFSFLDKEGALLWKIGYTDSNDFKSDFIGETTWSSWLKRETVQISENEVIVGVVAKLYGHNQSVYTDFQFQIGRLA